MINGAVVNVKDFGAKGDDSTDDYVAIQAAINYALKQYDPTETTMDGNNVVYRGKQKTVYFPQGTYRISQTLNISFRNDIKIIGESEYNTQIAYVGTLVSSGAIFNARCSSYVDIGNLTLDGRFKISCMIYCAGNGTAAPGSKGNVTGNIFHNLFFWNQIGDLTTLGDWPDQYNPWTAMLCLMTTTAGADTSYYSCDDSYVQNIRFATNSVNNSYAMAISSSNIQVSNSIVFAANGVLLGNGAGTWMEQMAWEIYGYQAIDATHNHAILKFAYNNFGQGIVTLTDCYAESGYNGTVPTTAILAYFAQYVGGGVGDSQPHLTLLIQGGLYSPIIANTSYINIQGGNRGNIRLVNASMQGTFNAKVYAPDCSVYVEDQSWVSSTSTDNYQTWQALSTSSFKSWERKFASPYFAVSGAVKPKATAYVGNTNYPAQLKFVSIDDAFSFLSTSQCDVEIILQKNDTITTVVNLLGNLQISLATYTLTFNAIVQNYGNLTIAGSGSAISTGKKLYNYGNLDINNATINDLVSSLGGVLDVSTCTFAGTASTIEVSQASQVIVSIDACTFSGSEYVIGLATGYGSAIIRSATTTTPTTGKWARGTKFETTLPASGSPVAYWATSNGVGASANWKSNGNLA